MVYVLSIVVSLVLWWANPADVDAATRFVSPSGSGSSCSSGAPCDIVTGINQTGSGDTLMLNGGTYDVRGRGLENDSLIISGARNGSTIEAAPGANVTLIPAIYFTGNPSADVTVRRGQGAAFVVDGQIGGGWTIFGTANCGERIRLEGLEAKWGIGGITGCWRFSQFMNLDVHHYGLDATGHKSRACACATASAEDGGCNFPGRGYCHGTYLDGNGVDNIFDGCSFHDGEGAGLEAQGQSHIFRNNTIYNNYSKGLWLLTGHSNALVYNNVIYNNGDNGISSAYGSNNHMYNNTIVGHSGAAITSLFGGGGHEIVNNILWNNGGTVEDDAGDSRYSAHHNLCNSTGAGCTLSGTTSATFASALGNDFHLKAGGPAIDTGVNLSSIFTTDIETHPRAGTWDIGAYEYAGSAPGPLSAPTNFRRAGK
jgi:hypothetical protein